MEDMKIIWKEFMELSKKHNYLRDFTIGEIV